LELEHADIELAKASRVANDLERAILAFVNVKGQYPGQPAAWCEDRTSLGRKGHCLESKKRA